MAAKIMAAAVSGFWFMVYGCLGASFFALRSEQSQRERKVQVIKASRSPIALALLPALFLFLFLFLTHHVSRSWPHV
jgi:amino acid transporter